MQNHQALRITTVHKRLKMVVSKQHLWIRWLVLRALPGRTFLVLRVRIVVLDCVDRLCGVDVRDPPPTISTCSPGPELLPALGY